MNLKNFDHYTFLRGTSTILWKIDFNSSCYASRTIGGKEQPLIGTAWEMRTHRFFILWKQSLKWRTAFLKRDDGSVALDHQEKAGILRRTYWNGPLTSVLIADTLDYAQYFTPLTGLEYLSMLFSLDEIGSMVAQMHCLSGVFLKLCWLVINLIWKGLLISKAL